jgi:alpha-tubulin suppressor-like RCC1 family protein
VPTVREELRNHRVRQVAAGYDHCAAVTEDGALYTWETFHAGDWILTNHKPVPSLGTSMPELGLGSFELYDLIGAPYRVFALEGIRITSVAVGDRFTLAVTEAGAVYSFGVGDRRLGHGKGHGEEGDGEDVFLPKRIEALDGMHVASVDAGIHHALALTRCGRVYLWGDRVTPQLGHGYNSDDDGDGSSTNHVDCGIPQRITVLLGQRVRAVAAGAYTSFAVTDTGALYSWGNNLWDSSLPGNLGHEDVRNYNVPTLVQRLHGIRVVAVSADAYHTLALAAVGRRWQRLRVRWGPGMGHPLSRLFG